MEREHGSSWTKAVATAITVACVSWLAAVGPSRAQTPVPAGGEFQVNTYTTDAQATPFVAAEPDGDFVVVWRSDGSSGSDASSFSVQGQRYDSAGSALGSEFQVNTYTTNGQVWPAVAVAGDGDFVVVWASAGSSGSDRSENSIHGRRYTSDGTALGAQFQVNTETLGFQEFPSVAVDADGDFVVVWTDGFDVEGQRYDSAGNGVGSEFQVSTAFPTFDEAPSVAAEPDGDFVVVWRSLGLPYDYLIEGRRYASDGTPQSAEFQINTYSEPIERSPWVAAEADGDFVVVWDSLAGLNDYDIKGRRYASDGTAQGPELQVNTYTADFQFGPAVAADADGDFVVVWTSFGSSGSDANHSIQGQRYDSAGSRVGSEFQVNTYTTGFQGYPSVAARADGDFVVAWQSGGSYNSAGQDGSFASIQAQRFTVPESSPALSRTLAAVVLALLVRGRRSRARGPSK